jgi:hypothetical protein
MTTDNDVARLRVVGGELVFAAHSFMEVVPEAA